MSDDRRAQIEKMIRETVERIDSAYRERIERAQSRGWSGELRKILEFRHRDVYAALKPLVEEYARLPIPPVLLEL